MKSVVNMFGGEGTIEQRAGRVMRIGQSAMPELNLTAPKAKMVVLANLSKKEIAAEIINLQKQKELAERERSTTVAADADEPISKGGKKKLKLRRGGAAPAPTVLDSSTVLVTGSKKDVDRKETHKEHIKLRKTKGLDIETRIAGFTEQIKILKRLQIDPASREQAEKKLGDVAARGATTFGVAKQVHAKEGLLLSQGELRQTVFAMEDSFRKLAYKTAPAVSTAMGALNTAIKGTTSVMIKVANRLKKVAASKKSLTEKVLDLVK